MSYTTVNEVREESGFSGNPYVTDENIQRHIDTGTACALGCVASIYNITQLDSTNNPNFANSQAYFFMKRMVELFASAELLIEEYGGDIDSDKNGYKKMKLAKMKCQGISDGSIRLYDINGNEIPRNSASTAGGPVGTINDPDAKPIFSINDKY